ncbi:MAG: nitric oxide synthase oxygenase, partial [Planctomycetota bacterium]
QLAGATVCGVWEQLGQIHHMILEGRTLKPWQEDIFRARGTLRLEEDSTFFEDSEPICSCLHVTRGALDQCIREGCNTAAELTERTGAGSVCGACIPRLRELCGCAEWTPVTVTEQIHVSDTVRSFRLTPASGELVAPLPGQHVVVQARIGNDWVQRPYTLTSDCTECDSYQITVKREPRGLLSGWLFDRCDEQSLLRVSAPLGTFTLAMDSKAPGACFVGGIGVTPAVAMARSLAATGSPHRLHIDLSSSEPETLAYLTKIAEQAKAQGLTVSTRLTSEAGHVTREDVAAVARELPGAIFFICGPKGFQEHVEGLLRLLDVPADRVRVETFTPQGDRPTRPGPLAKPKQTIGHPALPQPPGGPPGPRPGDKPPVPEIPARQRGPIDEEARAYLQRFYYEKGVEKAFESRWREVEEEIERTGTYVQTYDELSFGAKLAWRNSGRCIGRLFWSGLQVRDRRHLTSEEAIFEEICEHLRLATNGGNLRAVMTVFAPRQPGQPAPRLWNPQLLRYAGYPQIDGSWIGDPANAELTEACLAIGWDPGERTHFDILPLVMQLPGREPKLFELPRELILEVSLTHPEFDWFQDLGLRWHAVPAIAEMLFDCGGIQYSLAPFNGWYMGTEIGARNLSDEFRYNRLPDIAERMGLDLTRERSLWRDRALVELNIAVLHSFERAGAKMVDHHTAGNEFMEFVEQEVAAGRRIDGRWSWLVPPMSGSQSKAWPIGWYDLSIKPAYQYQKAPYKAWLRAQRRAARENRSHSSSVASGGNVESAGTRE